MSVRAKTLGSSLWSSYIYVSIAVYGHYAPSTPYFYSGSTTIKEDYTYTWGFKSTDYLNSGATLYYYVNWGDGTTSGGTAASGSVKYFSHKYYNPGTYTLKVKAKLNGFSDAVYSGYLYLSITVKSKPTSSPSPSPGPIRITRPGGYW